MTPPNKDDLTACVEAGMSLTDIGEKYDVSRQTARRWLRANGLKSHGKTGYKASAKSVEQDERIRSMRAEGATPWAISKALGCRCETVRRACADMTAPVVSAGRSKPSAYAFAMANPFGQAVKATEIQAQIVARMEQMQQPQLRRAA